MEVVNNETKSNTSTKRVHEDCFTVNDEDMLEETKRLCMESDIFDNDDLFSIGSDSDVASTDSENMNLEDSLTCKICYNLYYKPCTLACGHTFCKGCIHRHTLSSCRNGGEGNGCPYCRHPIDMEDSNSFTENITIQTIISEHFPEEMRQLEQYHSERAKVCYNEMKVARNALISRMSERDELSLRIQNMTAELEKLQNDYATISSQCQVDFEHARILRDDLETNPIFTQYIGKAIPTK